MLKILKIPFHEVIKNSYKFYKILFTQFAILFCFFHSSNKLSSSISSSLLTSVHSIKIKIYHKHHEIKLTNDSTIPC